MSEVIVPKENQEFLIMNHIKKHGFITNRDAVRMDIFRLSARVFDMRQKGIPIATDMVYGKESKYGRYYLKT